MLLLCDDIFRLMENLLCYLSNAEKYSTAGTISVSYSLYERDHDHDRGVCGSNSGSGGSDVASSPRKSGRFLRIQVEDEGIGVSDFNLQLLFQPFQQTMRLAGGTGLGLYSLAKRVEALHGEYGVTGRKDGKPGSQFWFSVPYHPDESSCVSEVTKSSQAIFSSHSTSSLSSNMMNTHAFNLNTIDGAVMPVRTALVVEDSVVVAKATCRMLTKAGYQVECAVNGALGLEKMKNKYYDLVLMDLQMPIMDGLEATRRFRAFESEQCDIIDLNNNESDRPPSSQLIIGVSANDYEGVIKEALACGMNDFISKPFSLQKLIEYQNKKEEDIGADFSPV